MQTKDKLWSWKGLRAKKSRKYIHVNEHLLDDICFHKSIPFFSGTSTQKHNRNLEHLFPSERPHASTLEGRTIRKVMGGGAGRGSQRAKHNNKLQKAQRFCVQELDFSGQNNAYECMFHTLAWDFSFFHSCRPQFYIYWHPLLKALNNNGIMK